ncbi:MAG TPA: hypothetical protein VF816_05620 [Rhodocyclaceae bacterium]
MLLKDNPLFKLVDKRHPQVAKRLFTFWGHPQAVWYLNDLIVDVAEDPAAGYTAEEQSAFEQLKREHEEEFPRAEGEPEWHVLTHEPDFKAIDAKFKRIGRRLKDLWGTAECPGYLNELIHDTRDGTRQGFPMDVAMAIFKLSRKHDQAFPQHAMKDTDLWGGI